MRDEELARLQIGVASSWKEIAPINLGRFQLPRYTEFRDTLPKTPAGTNYKVSVRADEQLPTVGWDREAPLSAPGASPSHEVNHA